MSNDKFILDDDGNAVPEQPVGNWEEREFMECDTCRAKPGSPYLCRGCLMNRASIDLLTSRAASEYQRGQEDGLKMGVLRAFNKITEGATYRENRDTLWNDFTALSNPTTNEQH